MGTTPPTSKGSTHIYDREMERQTPVPVAEPFTASPGPVKATTEVIKGFFLTGSLLLGTLF